jgi:4-hydroxy-tetrahydrodipicolinate synthase
MTENELKDGFYPALGTPTNQSGELITESFDKQTERMIESGASGVLCMGSMGKMATIRDREYPVIAKRCAEIVARRIPVMAGVMDCSVSRVLDRIEALDGTGIQGVVATAPFYYKVSNGAMINFFAMISKASKFPVFIYDLPSVTQTPVTGSVLKGLEGMENIKGIKTGNLDLALDLVRTGWRKDNFSVFYSGLDSFDAAILSGIRKNLDGMFTCTPATSKLMYECMYNGVLADIPSFLNKILILRNIFLKGNVLSAYSYSMELLGCPGNYHPDYDDVASEDLKQEIYTHMKSMKEI